LRTELTRKSNQTGIKININWIDHQHWTELNCHSLAHVHTLLKIEKIATTTQDFKQQKN